MKWFLQRIFFFQYIYISKNFARNHEKKLYLEHQINRSSQRPCNPAHYIEDCQISWQTSCSLGSNNQFPRVWILIRQTKHRSNKYYIKWHKNRKSQAPSKSLSTHYNKAHLTTWQFRGILRAQAITILSRLSLTMRTTNPLIT